MEQRQTRNINSNCMLITGSGEQPTDFTKRRIPTDSERLMKWHFAFLRFTLGTICKVINAGSRIPARAARNLHFNAGLVGRHRANTCVFIENSAEHKTVLQAKGYLIKLQPWCSLWIFKSAFWTLESTEKLISRENNVVCYRYEF